MVLRRLPLPPGWSSTGERKRDAYGNPIGLGLVQSEGALMARRNAAAAADDQTQDVAAAMGEEVARGQDEVNAALAARSTVRDALLDPQPGDIIPDNDEKGYHVGEVRQPAEPVLNRAGDVRYETIGDGEAAASKFETGNLRALKDAHNEREATDAAYAGVTHVPDALSAPFSEEAVRAARTPAATNAASDPE